MAPYNNHARGAQAFQALLIYLLLTSFPNVTMSKHAYIYQSTAFNGLLVHSGRWSLYASGCWDRFHCRVNRSLASAHLSHSVRLHTEQYTQRSQGLHLHIARAHVTYYARNYACAYANSYIPIMLTIIMKALKCKTLGHVYIIYVLYIHGNIHVHTRTNA